MAFEGSTIIVTGGARGIGRACVEAFAAGGAAVVIADLAVEAGQALAAEISGSGGKAMFVRADVADARDAGCLIDATLEWACGVDVLVCSAEIGTTAEFLDVRTEDLDAALRVPLQGAFLVGQAAARAMTARGRGVIVYVGPAAPALPLFSQVPQAVVAGGIAQLTRAMAAGLAGQRIRVHAIDPGAIASDSAVPASARSVEPGEVARLVLSLAGDAAYAGSGQCLAADSGRLAKNEAVSVAP